MVEGYKNPSTAVGQDHFLFGFVSYCFVLFNNLILRSGFRFVAAVRLAADNDLFTRLTCCFTAHSIAYRDFLLLHTHTHRKATLSAVSIRTTLWIFNLKCILRNLFSASSFCMISVSWFAVAIFLFFCLFSDFNLYINFWPGKQSWRINWAAAAVVYY